MGEERILTRHFDQARNPVKVRAVGYADDVQVIEMSVPDKRQKSGFSVLRFYVSRDARRIPMRIESSMPVAGKVTMTFVSAS